MPKLVPPPEPTIDLWALIAHHLRFLRLQKGKSQANVGAVINASVASVSRIERGEEALDEKQAALLDKEWDTGGLFGFLIYHARRGHNADWQQQHHHLEGVAHILRIYESLIVPGILQIEPYARALLLSGQYSARADELVAIRMRRAEIFHRDPAPGVWAILNENVLDWPVGGSQVMYDQLAHLVAVVETDRVGIRVLPRSSGASPGVDGSFKIMTIDAHDVVFSESSGGGRLVQDPAEVRSYHSRYERIGARALPQEDSLALIHQRMEALQR